MAVLAGSVVYGVATHEPPLPTVKPTTPPPEKARARILDIRDFGARSGDLDSTPAVEAALKQASRNAKTGVRVRVQIVGEGRPYHCGAITVPSRVQLVGTGDDPHVVAVGDIDYWVTMATGAAACGISSLRLDTAGRVAEAAVAVSAGTRGVTLSNIEVVGQLSAPPFAGAAVLGDVSRIRIIDSRMRRVMNGVIVEGKSRNVTIEKCEFDDWVERAIWVRGSRASATSLLTISECRVGPHAPGGSARRPIQFNSEPGGTFTDVRIVDNRVTGAGTDHKDTQEPGTADLIALLWCRRFEISRNVCVDGGEMGITVAKQSTEGRVIDNTCSNNGAVGIVVGSEASRYVSDILVSGNVCRDNGRHGRNDATTAAGRSGIRVFKGRNITLTDNVCGNTGTNDSQMYGIWIGESDVVVGDNELSGNSTAEILRDTEEDAGT